MATGRKIQQLQKAFRARKEKLVPGKPTLLPQPVASIFLCKAL
jgi:hypothetical protein